jgi:nitroimidazol reductase NimA-like FMN-containing flavoprotein (pyridoxamine 5'-phosphate oxidase superfamily)
MDASTMKLTDARTGIEVIAREECFELLRDEVIGRLVIVHGGAPHVYPVNHAVDGEDVVFRTDAGSKLDVGPRAPACFESDHFDPRTRTGWDVVVSGRLEEITELDGDRLRRAAALPIDPWAHGERTHWMRLVARDVTGRRIAR